MALQINLDAFLLDLDSANAHTFCSRDSLEDELESNIIYHYLLDAYRNLYGKNVTVQWHFGNGPGMPPSKCHLYVDGLRQGDASATIFFNILVAKVYRKQLYAIDGRGVLFAIADDVKIIAPPLCNCGTRGRFPSPSVERGESYLIGGQEPDLRATLCS